MENVVGPSPLLQPQTTATTHMSNIAPVPSTETDEFLLQIDHGG
jgi:hypothetical protein